MYSLGVDVGGMSIKAGIVDLDGKIILKKVASTRAHESCENIIKDIANLIKETLKEGKLKISDLKSIGIGIPGLCDDSHGTVEYCCNINLVKINLVEKLKNILKYNNIFVSNDANCAVLAESKFGVASGSEDCVLITIGTGIGTGIISSGRPLKGRGSLGSEGGHMIIDVDGETCGCGEKGHFESYASIRALSKQTQAVIDKNPDSILAKVTEGKGTGRTAFIAEREGDPLGTQIIEQFLKYVAIGALTLHTLFVPEYIIIGGAISNEGKRLTDSIQKYIDEHKFAKGYVPEVKVVTSELKNDAGIIGAAFLYSVSD